MTQHSSSVVPTNVLTIGKVKFEALGDRVLIREDQFKSGYECQSCGGTGRSSLNPEMRCKDCEGKGGLLVVPDNAQRRPTSGEVVSCGPDCKTLSVGDSVLYSSFAGYSNIFSDGGEQVVVRILHENEVLCRVDGHIELRTIS